MKTILLLCHLLLTTTIGVFSQVVANVRISGDLEPAPGATNEITIHVKNTQKVAIVKYKSDYTIEMVYRGSTTAGKVFNKEVSLGDPLDPGDIRNMRIRFTGPVLPGEYDVDVLLKWGNKTVSNVCRATFVIAADYTASINVKTIALNIKRGVTRTTPIRLTATNNGRTTWPEGNYSFQLSVVSNPAGASDYDKKTFGITGKTMEKWDFEPGESDEYDIINFNPPYTAGSYKVKVTLLLNGKPFSAEGASENFTFKVNVSN